MNNMCWIQQSVEPEFLMKNNSISIISSSGTITKILSIYVHGDKQALLNQCDKILRGIEGVTTSFLYISQPQRAQIEPVFL